MNATLRTALVALALTGTPALAQMDHSMPSMNHTATQATTDLTTLSGKAFDRAFLSMMTAHHQGAVDMSVAALKNARDPQVKAWAKSIIQDQQREIQQMRTWLKSLGGLDEPAQAMMTRDMQGMVTALKANSANADRAFVQGMLPHHASAITMASITLQRSSDPRVLKLARDIIRAQAGEMYDFRQWLLKR